MSKFPRFLLLMIIILGFTLILVTLALAAATVGVVNNRLKKTSTATTDQQSSGSVYVDSIRISDVMKHLSELQRIGNTSNGNRADNTIGFNRTLDYIFTTLSSSTDFKVQSNYFYLRKFLIGGSPTLWTSINGVISNRTFSNDLSVSEFIYAQYTRSANFPDFVPITAIPNLGCSETDWLNANPSPNSHVALVKRGDCDFATKAALASKYNVSALLIYNDGNGTDRMSPININLGQNNELRALFLSYNLGNELATAANASVRMIIPVADESVYPAANICADTQSGDATQTIVIGSHSDSVPAGPGINDNGESYLFTNDRSLHSFR